jgi:two-component system NarL family sensor kinase
LQAAVPWYLSSFSERSGIRVDLEMPPDIAKLPDQIELTVFRILQECLTNVHRHSGSKVAKVKIAPGDNNIALEVGDEGRGLIPQNGSGEPAGVGITGMRERVHELGGNFEIASTPAGTVVKAVLPISEKIESRVAKFQTGVANNSIS